MTENTEWPPNGCKEENMLKLSLKLNLTATKPKVDALKSKVSSNTRNNTIKDLINLKENFI
jgi:hypothetical protein